MRNIKLAWNTLSGLLLQVTTVICGFILPRAILSRYGSEVNGLVNSVAQFLQMIAFLELGVGAVIQSALYKPLADEDSQKISEVIASGSSFFRKLGAILVVYVAVLMVAFPVLVDDTFGFAYTASLILAMSISHFARYYFGIIDSLLLDADQQAYVLNLVDIIALIVNTALCYLLVTLGYSIQVVKFTTAGIFLATPIAARLYIRRNYSIDRKCKFTVDPVEQKWNGVAQHIAAIVLDSTDVAVLSIFATMSDVSVYSVYLLVVSGIKNLILSCCSGIGSLFGELWAKEEREELDRYFGISQWAVHVVSLFVWCCTYKLIIPFVMIYTEGVTDVNYNVPLFAALICIAYMLYCLRLPFNEMILAAGHYRNTQGIFIGAAAINLVLSILAVRRWGLVGVTVGTIVAMLYQMLHMGYYVIRRLKVHSFMAFLKQIAFDVAGILLVLYVTAGLSGEAATWLGWILLAVKHAVVIAICILGMGIVCYNKVFRGILRKILQKG